MLPVVDHVPDTVIGIVFAEDDGIVTITVVVVITGDEINPGAVRLNEVVEVGEEITIDEGVEYFCVFKTVGEVEDKGACTFLWSVFGVLLEFNQTIPNTIKITANILAKTTNP